MFKNYIDESQRQGLFESSDVASNRTIIIRHELSNPSSSVETNFIYTPSIRVRQKNATRINKKLPRIKPIQISSSGNTLRSTGSSTNHRFIEFQTRAIFIFEQSQVGRARSELRPGSSLSALFAPQSSVGATLHS